MLSITDEHGVRWQVLVGKESFGGMVFLFARVDSDIVLRHAVPASSRLDAERSLRDMDVNELRRLLGNASPWSGTSEASSE